MKRSAIALALSLGAASALSSGCGPQCDPPAGDEICTSPEPTCLPEGAQICPRISPIAYCEVTVDGGPLSGPYPGAYVFMFTIENYGLDPLTIDDIRIVGDDRCALYGLDWSPRDQPIPSLGSLSVVFYYDPPAEGEDHLWIEVSSNAENYAVLPIPICGDAVAANPTATCVLCDRIWSPGLPTSSCP